MREEIGGVNKKRLIIFDSNICFGRKEYEGKEDEKSVKRLYIEILNRVA